MKTYLWGASLLGIAASAALVAWLAGSGVARVEARTPAARSSRSTLIGGEPIQPIPTHLDLDPRTVALGERLFHEPRLSADDSVSCASCHSLELAGTDRRKLSVGIGGQLGDVNAPTVFNSAFNFKQFWDGRADTLEDQAAGPVHNPKEMGSDWTRVIAKLREDAEYVRGFEAIYEDGMTARNLQNAIATFERSLITPNSRFDLYLRGDATALNDEEKEGYRIFKSYGCVSCHQGTNVGGNMLETFGVMADYFGERGGTTKADLGRYNVTSREEDRHVFKVPSLRLAALTPPYFHDGSAKRLEDAVRTMAKYQLGRILSDQEVARIVAFLKTLPGEYKGRPLLAHAN